MISKLMRLYDCLETTVHALGVLFEANLHNYGDESAFPSTGNSYFHVKYEPFPNLVGYAMNVDTLIEPQVFEI